MKQRTSAPVLVEALKSGKVIVPPSVIAARLAVRGLAVTADQVKQIFTEHGIEGEKKRRSANDNAYILKTEGALSE